MLLETWKQAELSYGPSEVQEAICPLVVTTKHILALARNRIPYPENGQLRSLRAAITGNLLI